MPWPSKITRAFATFERGAEFIVHGNQYHGPYNKVLNTLFPADSDFIVSPNYLPGNIDAGTAFIVSFEVTLRRHPVFMLEIKPPQHLSLRSTQETADKQIRRRLVDLSELTPLPILYGISAVGTRLCFHEFEKASRRTTPRFIPRDPEFATDVAPLGRWDCDVLEADGEQRLRALATHIRGMRTPPSLMMVCTIILL
ncbi:hypothetical protein BC827DRAFT_1348802 [Russula dissimulans]|nr:hypothetical protein BC827DRAFT_1348802 [Russula dissimulans]